MAFLTLEQLTKHFGSHVAVDGLTLGGREGRVRFAAGAVGLRQDHDAADDRGLRRAERRRDPARGPRSPGSEPAKRGLGIVFQSYALFPHMTRGGERRLRPRDAGRGRRPSAPGAWPRRWSWSASAAFAARFPRQLSGGQQQRVALARALVIKPQILLLDEPLSNLDAKLREEMQIELRQIQRTVGTTTILVTHDQAEAMALSDRIVVMNKGRAEQVAAPHEAYERPATPFVANFLGKTNPDRRQGHAARSASGLRPPASRALSERASSRAITGSTRSIRAAACSP